MNEEWFLSFGASIGYWQGDVNKLLDDVGALKPALFLGVPRVFDRIYARVMGMVSFEPWDFCCVPPFVYPLISRNSNLARVIA